MNDYASIADLYDSYVTETRDHAFWSRWADRATGPILELTAGTGRATAALRSGASQPVVALDLAPAMLRCLTRRFVGTRQVRAVAGDLTQLPFVSGHFALAVIPFNSLGELIEEADRRAALCEMRRVLAPGGLAIVTLHDPARRRQTLDGEVRMLGPFRSGGRRLEVLVCGRLLAPDLAESQQTYRVLDGADRVIDERRLTLRFVLPDATSLLGMATSAGFERQAMFGDYDESSYVPEHSPFILAILRRP